MFQTPVKRFPILSAIIFVVCFVAFLVIFLDSFRSYRAEATLLVISKSSSQSSEIVARNLSELVKTVPFYDAVLSDHGFIADPWTNASSPERRDAWSRVIDAFVIPGTSLIRVSVSSQAAAQSSTILGSSIETLYGFSSRMYHRDREADVRLVDPVSVQAVVRFPLAVMLTGICFAGSLTAFALLLIRYGSFSGWANAWQFSSFRTETHVRPIGSFPTLGHAASINQDVSATEEVIPSQSGESNSKNSGDSYESQVPTPSLGATYDILNDTARDIRREASEDPGDIWERSRLISASPDESSVRTGSVAGETVGGNVEDSASSVQENTLDSDHKTSVGVAKNSGGTTASVPRNLEGIPAEDFSWDDYLFHSDEDVSRDTPASSKSPAVAKETPSVPRMDSAQDLSREVSSQSVGQREPTPEELKNRLNQLLRGEL